jgi:SAM-dependent methyltransferase
VVSASRGLPSAPAGRTDAAGDSAAVRAFDAVAPEFDQRFGSWASVQAQRRAVRRRLLAAFPPGSALLELGGGTGDDALFLAARGRRVLLTDAAPAMLDRAAAKVRQAKLEDAIVLRPAALEDLRPLAAFRGGWARAPYDGAYSNFAALNCVEDLGSVARGLAPLVRPGANVLFVVFGRLAVGEIALHLLRGDPRTAFRRLSRGTVPARLGGRSFTVRYPSAREIASCFAPHLRLVRRWGIGIFVPPSAAEPAISRWPRVVRLLELMDRVAGAPLGRLGDHVVLHFVRTKHGTV